MTRSRHRFQLALALFLMVCALSFDYLSRVARAENAALKRSSVNTTSIKDNSVHLAENFSQGIRDAVERIRPSLVTIRPVSNDSEASVLPPSLPEFSDGDYSPFNNLLDARRSDVATGVIVSEDGYIWTSSDVVASLNSVIVTLQNTSYEGKVVCQDLESGLAIIKVEAEKLPAARRGDVTDPRLADWAVAVALNEKHEPLISAGLVSSVITEFESQRGIKRIRFAFPTSADFAGCAFVDLGGDLIAINALNSSRIAGDSISCTALAAGSANEVHQQAVEDAATKSEELSQQKSIVGDSIATQYSTQERKEGKLSKIDTIGDLFSVPRSQWTSATIASSVRSWLTSRQDGKGPQKSSATNASESR